MAVLGHHAAFRAFVTVRCGYTIQEHGHQLPCHLLNLKRTWAEFQENTEFQENALVTVVPYYSRKFKGHPSTALLQATPNSVLCKLNFVNRWCFDKYT